MGALCAHTRSLRASIAFQQDSRQQPLHRHALNNHPRGAAGAARQLALALATGRRRRQLHGQAQARGGGKPDYDADYVAFDDEEDWEQTGSPVRPFGLSPILSTALRGVAAITDRLTDLALQFAPASASPGVVRVAVNAGLVLLALSFVKSLLSFFLTLGTIILGAYVAVKVFGLDIPAIGDSSADAGSSGGSGSRRGSASKQTKPRGERRRLDPRARQSEFKGLLGASRDNVDDSGLLDVWFERKGDNSSGGGGRGSSAGGSSGRGRGEKSTRRR